MNHTELHKATLALHEGVSVGTFNAANFFKNLIAVLEAVIPIIEPLITVNPTPIVNPPVSQ